jgi:nitrogen fixation NifU-like protein
VAVHYSERTIDHFQHPRNVGRLPTADAVGRIDDAASETMVSLYVRFDGERVAQATFRTFGCSACIAASSVATELLLGRSRTEPPSADDIDAALDRLPAEKRYCADLVAEAARRALGLDR